MATEISAETLREWLYDGEELALMDVREPGQAILGHILFSAPLPFSRFENALPALVPNPGVRIVLCDAGDGVAARAAAAAGEMGYAAVHVLRGGVQSWADAGHTLYQGVNVPSKAFGELVEHADDTPRLTADEIAKMQAEQADMVIVDGRPLPEFAKMSIPGASCCPNGELALRAAAFAPSPETTIIVNCAGRTRSIIGAQTLIDAGVPNPVYAMENGTQGWTLAGLTLDHGREGALPSVPQDLAQQQQNARALAARHGVETIHADGLEGWLEDADLTVYLLDVRTAEERAGDDPELAQAMTACGVVHAPGGQLVQATDQWIGVRNARIVLLDAEDVRAPITASWLRRLGHRAFTLEEGLEGLEDLEVESRIDLSGRRGVGKVTPEVLAARIGAEDLVMLDLRSSAAYRAGHVVGATWAVRPRLPKIAGGCSAVLITEDAGGASLVAKDLIAQGAATVQRLTGGMQEWRAAGLEIEVTPDSPADADRIDFQSFTAGRHEGDEAASRQYLAWEIALVDQLDADERAVFRV